MPVRRRTYRRRVAPRRGRKLNKRQKNEVKRIIAVRQELKFFVTPTNAFQISSTGVTFPLTLVTQGDTDQTRDGDRLYAKKMYVRGYIEISDTTNIVRLVFYQWKPNSTATLGDIFLPGPTGAIDVDSHYNHDTRQQFKILWDRTFVLEGNQSAATAPVTSASIRRFQMVLSRGMNRQLQFNGGGTAATNHIYYAAISDSGIANHPELTMSTKFMFTDS